ncbi:transcription factor bHLH95-like [Senna tora]|uniref:Transcription factor bHLH95-like n=1 Tax=Senna tora TaxID=362788 RepID=A0A835CGN0_9FABA|nr:transcription factor bHLH95-like [Senna tora]KAF7840842.1 transcription factor bHLH95-like [Senna tora]
MSNQEQDPNMTPWPLFDFDDNTHQKSNINPNCSNNIKIIDSKEGEPEASGGGSGDNTIKSTRRSRGKRIMSSGSKRKRTNKMRNNFSDLHALLPHLPPQEAVKYIKSMESELQKLEKENEERLKLQQIQSASTTLESPASQWLQYPYDHNNSSNNNNINGNNFVSAANTENDINNIIGTPSNNNNNNNVNYNNSLEVGFRTWFSPNVVLNTLGEMAQLCVCYPKNLRLSAIIAYVLQKHNIDVLSPYISSDHNRRFYVIQAQINGDSNEFSDRYSAEEIFLRAAEEIVMWIS